MPRPARLEALVFLLALWTFVFTHDAELGTNSLAHFDQTVSIVEHGTLEITKVLFTPDGKTIDWSAKKGEDGKLHFYPAKAPGLSLVGVPVYAALSKIERLFSVDPLEHHIFQLNGRLVAIFTVALPGALGALAFLRLARDSSPRAAAIAAVTLAVATTYSPYATALYAHVPTAAALAFAALWLEKRPLAAGICCGFAVLFSYQAALPVVILAVVGRRKLPWFALGGLPAFVAMLAIHKACFGSPWANPYDFQNPVFTPGGRGGSYAGIVQTPGLERFLSVLVFPYRGLFFYAPVLAFTFVKPRVTPLAVLASIVFITAIHPIWWGGFSSGPRLLVPGLALLAPLLASGFERFPRAFSVLAAVSFLNGMVATFASLTVPDHTVPPYFARPLTQALYPGFSHGHFERGNLGLSLGLSPFASVALYLVVAVLLLGGIVNVTRSAKVVFACVHNAGRSQIAAAFFNELADPRRASALSAGTAPGDSVHPVVADVMKEIGIDLSAAKPQKLTPEMARAATILVTMGCGESCPAFHGRHLDWPLPDPKGQPVERVREIRDEIKKRVEELVAAEGWRVPV